MTTDAHTLVPPKMPRDWPLAFVALMTAAVVFALLRGMWPPDESRLHNDSRSGMHAE